MFYFAPKIFFLAPLFPPIFSHIFSNWFFLRIRFGLWLFHLLPSPPSPQLYLGVSYEFFRGFSLLPHWVSHADLPVEIVHMDSGRFFDSSSSSHTNRVFGLFETAPICKYGFHTSKQYSCRRFHRIVHSLSRWSRLYSFVIVFCVQVNSAFHHQRLFIKMSDAKLLATGAFVIIYSLGACVAPRINPYRIKCHPSTHIAWHTVSSMERWGQNKLSHRRILRLRHQANEKP